jgi:hypothetical protein
VYPATSEKDRVRVPRVLAGIVDALLAPERLGHVHTVHGGRVLHQHRRAEEQAVDDAEHGGIRSDPEPEGDDDGDGEAWLQAQAAQAVLEVVAKVVEDHDGMTQLGRRRVGAISQQPSAIS